MSNSGLPINKISRPRTAKVFQRERLFRLLDENRACPIIWISSPAGAGKTTLITSYLESRNLDCLWYQIDARDADPAAFFYYMSLAVKQATPRKRKTLPLLSPEFMPGIQTFVLRYFESVFQRLTSPMVMVLDNFQVVPEDSILPQLLASGLTIIPDHISVIVISRRSPPPDFTRLVANRKVIQLGWQQIRLTQDETAGIASMQTEKACSETMVKHLHLAVDGWAAGLMLMLAQADVEKIDWQWIQESTSQEIFDYFSKEVFDREPPEIQDFLLSISYLPYMSVPMAKSIAGHPQTGRILSELNRNNRFTERRYYKTIIYQLHPLFREFLQSRSRERNKKSDIDALNHSAATLFQKEGDLETAAGLLCQAKAWDRLAELILNHAQPLLQQGRNRTILNWLANLPEKMFAQLPWLTFWQGTAVSPFDPGAGRKLLEKAFDTFHNQRDAAGLFLSWAGIIRDIFLVMADISPFDHWIEVLEDLMTEYKEFPDKTIEGQVVSGMLIILTHRQMHHPNIKVWVERAHALLSGLLDLNTKVSLINNAAHYYLLTGDYGKAWQLLDLVGPTELANHVQTKGSIANAAYATILSHYCCYVGEHRRCIDIVTHSLEHSKKTGMYILSNILSGYGLWSAIINEDDVAAKALYDKSSDCVESAGPLDRGLYETVQSLEALAQGSPKKAAGHAQSALEASIGVGSQFSTIFCHLINARTFHSMGDQKNASVHLGEAFRLSELTHSKHFLYHAHMLDARFTLDQGDFQAGLVSLQKALSLGRQIGIFHNVIDSRANIARIYAIALEHGIEEQYATEYIGKRKLLPDPPPVHLENWPWPLKIYTLGRFSILKSGKSIQFTTKAQKKPLELLKSLIAFGGRDVNKTQICDALWPEADGDKAHQAFATTLHRLRHLLGSDTAIRIIDGKLDLNPSCCWVDCWAFERLLSQAEAAHQKQNVAQAIEFGDKAMDLYKSAFLAGDEAEPWSVSKRERLRFRFLSSATMQGDLLESEGKWEAAVACYQRCLDIDDLAEEIYRRLMHCLKHLGRATEALAIYHRCEKTLLSTLGLEPSSETKAVFKSLIRMD